MASHGGTISIKANELARTWAFQDRSGNGWSQDLAEQLGFKNVDVQISVGQALILV